LDFLSDTWPKLTENLAVDELLLARAERCPDSLAEILRVWRPSSYAVVVGRGSRIALEVDLEFCETQGIPVYRRHSGGAAVVIGPGCWIYSVLLNLRLRPELRDLNRTHQYVMERVHGSTQALVPTSDLRVQGICDLTVGSQKCSGNSLRVARDHLLYHGTLLVDFDLSLVERCLKTPPRQPAYRQQRPHRNFVTNLPWDRLQQDEGFLWKHWCHELRRSWGAAHPSGSSTSWLPDSDDVSRLAREKYENPLWIAAR
jgi:lipoate---protein ligase